MILKLILKDLRAFGLQLFLFLIILLFFNCFMAANDRNASWWLFILITSGGVSTIIPAMIALEKKYKVEIITGSLPVSRKEIVQSKFLILFGFAAAGYASIYLTALIFNNVFNYNDFYIFSNPVMLLIVFTYFSILINITVLLSCVTDNIIWLIIADLTFLVLFILGMEKVIFPGGLSESYTFWQEGIVFPAVLAIIIFSIHVSIKLSTKFYAKKDL